jgi:cell division initiation protein
MKADNRKLTSDEIRSREFTKKIFGFGYDPEEVDTFLMQVADAYQELVEELENLRNAYKQVDREDLVEDARKKIKFLVQERKRIEKDIDERRKQLTVEIQKLKLARKKLLRKVGMVIFQVISVLKDIKDLPGL